MVPNDELVRNVMRELELSEEERLIRLGKQNTPQGIGSDADDFDDEHYKRLGASLLSRIMERARKKICESDEIRTAVTKLGSNAKIALVAPIADVVATLVSGPAIFTATASIITIGLPAYCGKYWSDTRGLG